MSYPRPEHPKPQFLRQNWQNLNGPWAFEIDCGNSGEARGLAAPDAVFSRVITVPFCPESPLSGIGYLDFMPAVWYQRTVTVTAAQLQGRVVLHFGAVDYHCTLFVNGQNAGEHKGGYVSFSFEITSLLHEGDNVLTVRAQDDVRNGLVPSGKQSTRYESYSCLYRRCTGIWQTVWLEFTPQEHLAGLRLVPHPEQTAVTAALQLAGRADLRVKVSYKGRLMAEQTVPNAAGRVVLRLPLAESHLWEVGHGRLYDVEITFGDDRVESYFGLRSVEIDGMRMLLNGRSVFQRLVLDQGYYPDGIYTAPTDAELEADVTRSQAMGFNGARLHQKIFEERFLYHCDRHGYLVWGEYPCWGVDYGNPRALHVILREWLEMLQRDFNHPAIVGWCPFNETHPNQIADTLAVVYRATKAADPTRPCIDTSGYIHVETDVFDLHDYDQNPETFRERYASFAKGGELVQSDHVKDRQRYGGQPVFISEYGGIKWSTDEGGWGYGQGPQSESEFLDRFRGLTEALLQNPRFFGLCYTQLTDVEQEQNGLYTFDRKAKFDPAVIAAVLTRKAAIED